MKKLKQWLRVRHAYLLSYFPVRQPAKKFVVFGQGRTGSTLFVDLLNDAGDIRCDREIFNVFHFTGEVIKNPLRYIIGRSKRFGGQVYGFKVKVYQLKYDHHVRSAGKLLQDLQHEGYRIVYLTRSNVLEHAYSNVKRSLTGVTHVKDNKMRREKLTIPPELLVNEIRERLKFKAEETEALAGISYLHINYERHLQDPAKHLETVNKLRTYLDLPPVDGVKSRYRKITEKSLEDEMENFSEVSAALRTAGLDHLMKNIS